MDSYGFKSSLLKKFKEKSQTNENKRRGGTQTDFH